MSNSIYDFKVKNIDGEEVSLETYKGKTLLFVNVASKCGFTNQYTGLESLYKNLKEKDVVVLGFPCNQFGAQEPGSDADVKEILFSYLQCFFPNVLARLM